MDVAQFDFALPERHIALRPAVPRDSARMLVVREDGSLEHSTVSNLASYLRVGDAVVVNDSKVIHARLHGVRVRDTQPKIELMLHKRLSTDSYAAFARPARKLVAGDTILFANALTSQVVERGEGGEIFVRFNCAGVALDRAIAEIGEVPLPPYIAGKRKPDARDISDYQTIFSRHEGSVAAPTAGLHFTPELVAQLASRGIRHVDVTLHVGAGTFLPVSVSDTGEHKMHAEWARVSDEAAATLNAVRAANGRIAAIGTTALRTLESAAQPDGQIAEFSGETAIFITPGYRFRTAEILLTNFHLPRSTLFMLVSAFCGLETMRAAYEEAIREGYRFYSYGDACLLFRRPQ